WLPRDRARPRRPATAPSQCRSRYARCPGHEASLLYLVFIVTARTALCGSARRPRRSQGVAADATPPHGGCTAARRDWPADWADPIRVPIIPRTPFRANRAARLPSKDRQTPETKGRSMTRRASFELVAAAIGLALLV